MLFLPKMSKFKIKIESDQYDGLCRDLVDMAIQSVIESRDNNCHVLLQILQLLLSGEWEEP